MLISSERSCLTVLLLCSFLSSCLGIRPGEEVEWKQDNFTIIEFDDQGQMFNDDQLDHVIKEVKVRHDRGETVNLVIYVHGWKHNAASNDVRRFKNYLSQIKKKERQDVLGVYIAWRGDIYNNYDNTMNAALYVPRQLSFWNRKSTANRVSGTTATHAILGIAAEVRLGPKGTTNKDFKSRITILGHSMGGLIVERAVAQAMVGDMLISNPQSRRLREDIENLNDQKSDLEAKTEEAKEEFQEAQNQYNLRKQELEREPAHSVDNDERVILAVNQLAELSEKSKIKFAENAVNRQRNTDLQSSIDLLPNAPPRFTGDELIRLLMLRVSSDSSLLSKESLIELLKNPKMKIKEDNNTLDAEQLRILQEQVEKARPPDEPDDAFVSVQRDLIEAISKEKIILENRDKKRTLLQEQERLKRELANEDEALRALVVEEEILEKRVQKERSDARERINKEIEEQLSELQVQLALKSSKLKKLQEQKLLANADLLAARRKTFSPPADLILLVNPASESMLASKLQHSLNSSLFDEFKDSHGPFIISISSKGDWATGRIFPAARALSSLGKRFVDFSQRLRFMLTGPNNSEVVTHTIEQTKISEKNIKITSNKTNNFDTVECDITDCGENVEFKLKVCSKNPGKYWVIRASEKIIGDHGDFFENKYFLKWMEKFETLDELKAAGKLQVQNKDDCGWPT